MTREATAFQIARRVPALREPLLYAWRRGWLPAPSGQHRAVLNDGRVLTCQLDDHTQRRMALDRFEPAESALFRALLRPGDLVVDVGAHIGWFSTLAGSLVAPGGQVLAFEAFPDNFQSLQHNVIQSGLTTVQPQSVAIGSADGTLQVGRQTGSDSGSVTAVTRERQGTVAVPVTTLDAAAAELRRIRLIKMDVEGFEAQVLAGAAQTLSRAEALMFELNGHALAAAGSSPESIVTTVADHGFRHMWILLDHGLRRLRRAPSWLVNVIAVKDESVFPGWARRGLRLRALQPGNETHGRASSRSYLYGLGALFAPTLDGPQLATPRHRIGGTS